MQWQPDYVLALGLGFDLWAKLDYNLGSLTPALPRSPPPP